MWNPKYELIYLDSIDLNDEDMDKILYKKNTIIMPFCQPYMLAQRLRLTN